MDLSILHDPGIDNDDNNRSELDSHAVTCVAGVNTVSLYFTEHKVSVSPFIGSIHPYRMFPLLLLLLHGMTPEMVAPFFLSSMKHYILESECHTHCFVPTR